MKKQESPGFSRGEHVNAVSAEVRAHADREHRRKAIRAARVWLGALIVGALRIELIQVAAVATQWAAAIERRAS